MTTDAAGETVINWSGIPFAEPTPDYFRFYEDPLWLRENNKTPMDSVELSLPWNFPHGPHTNAEALAWDYNFNPSGYTTQNPRGLWFNQPGDEFYFRIGSSNRLIAGCDQAWLGFASEAACTNGDATMYVKNVDKDHAPMLKLALFTQQDIQYLDFALGDPLAPQCAYWTI